MSVWLRPGFARHLKIPPNFRMLLLLTLALPLLAQASNPARTSAPALDRTITIATGEYPPWVGSSLPHNGYVNHIINEAFASQGLKVEFVYLPWKRAFEETRQGKFDATSYWYENDERREAMLFSDTVITNRIVFFQRADAPKVQWKTFNDLAPYRMSITLGYTYSGEFYQAIDSKLLNPIIVSSDVQNLKLLMAKRVDFFATDEMSGYYMAAQLSIDPRKLAVIEPALIKPQGYLLAGKINPDSQLIINTFNRGLRTIKANGKYQKILNRIDATSFYNPNAKTQNSSAR
ncbi:MAG: transporter substrate-binding domain-containing protein [Cellvibrio sp.]|uniref:substrate-binding periplasmic protein n=1 Tax=Cellvibrio sp. TaxID=1965322 RepID=UPI0031A09553